MNETVRLRPPPFGILLAAGAAGGGLFHVLGAPMPFLLGSLAAAAPTAMIAAARGREVRFPQGLRKLFIGCIGAMIGSTFSRDLFAVLPGLWASMLAMGFYVASAHAIAYQLFRRVAGYDRVTAFYAAMPGGLIEAVAVGEQAGGDVRILSVQHFARIVLVVVSVPLLFYVWRGETAGS